MSILHRRKVLNPDIELDIELDEDHELGVAYVEPTEAPRRDPCKGCEEIRDCYEPCTERRSYVQEYGAGDDIDWDDKPSRRVEIY